MATADAIMTADVITTTPESDIWEVAHVLLDNSFGGMPVIGASGELVGMISGFDVISKRGSTVGEIMSRGVVWANPQDTFETVVQMMGLHGIRRIPVCTDGQLVGIISRSDLLRHRTSLHDQEP